jgi:hypothetical protein
LKPKLRFKRPMDIPFSMPNPITALASKGLCSNNFMHNATWREQKVTRRCQLVKVVAAFDQTKISIYDGKKFFWGGGTKVKQQQYWWWWWWFKLGTSTEKWLLTEFQPIYYHHQKLPVIIDYMPAFKWSKVALQEYMKSSFLCIMLQLEHIR